MSRQHTRDLITQAFIALAVCVGGWLLLVRPKVEELARLETLIREQESLSASGADERSIEAAAAGVKQMRARLEQIKSLNLLAEDTSRFYGMVMDLADAHHVQVKSVQPGSSRSSSKDGRVSVARTTLRVAGPYAGVAEFIDAVCEMQGFVRLVHLQLAPSRSVGGDLVEVDVGCDLLSFGTDVLHAGGSHDER